MTINDLKRGYTYVVGTKLCFPPHYARFTLKRGWGWTHVLTDAEAFDTKAMAMNHIENDVGLKKIINGDENVRVLKIQFTESEA